MVKAQRLQLGDNASSQSLPSQSLNNSKTKTENSVNNSARLVATVGRVNVTYRRPFDQTEKGHMRQEVCRKDLQILVYTDDRHNVLE